MIFRNKKTSVKKNRSRAAVLFAVFFAVFLAAAGEGVLLWLNGHFLPLWISWHERSFTITTYEPHPIYPNPGFVPVETGKAELKLSKRKIRIYSQEDGPSIYTSPSRWYISDVAVEDINDDGIEEILLICWKRGRYSGAKPFWESRDEIGFSQHLYIFHYQDNALVPIWMSSYLPVDVLEMTVSPEGIPLLSTEGDESLWVWEHWGLKLRE